MGMRVLNLAFLLIVAGVCQSCDRSLSPEQIMARCGGVKQGLTAVVAGTENEFFTAASRQVINIKPGVEIQTGADAGGKDSTLTLVAQERRVSINCDCPSGCSATGSAGCIISQSPPGSPIATCSGDCGTTNSCCFGCGWVF